MHTTASVWAGELAELDIALEEVAADLELGPRRCGSAG